MKIRLSDHFTYAKLFRFTLPSIAMMIFTSFYGIVDGYFVSNSVGKTPFAAVNFIIPVLMVFGAIGSMLGTGGTALISKTLGEGDHKKANSLFSLFVYFTIAVGVVIAAIAYFLLPDIASLLGAEGEMLALCVEYGRINILGIPAWMLQFEFQSFFVLAEKPHLGFATTVAAGVANMFLDWLFVGTLDMGVAGAAIATVIGQCIGGLFPLVYFALRNSSLLRLTAFRFDGRALLAASTNGMSEFLSNISMSVIGILYNVQLMKYAGENGVAAYGTLMYVCMIFIGIFIGYAVGIAPVIGFHYGAQNHEELKNLFRKSIVITSVCSLAMLAFSEGMARPLSLLFVGYDEALLDMTIEAFVIFSFGFLFSGISIFGSSFFTALNNGFLSAMISFLRTMLFQVVAVLTLPLLFGLNGIWYSLIAAEFCSAAVAIALLICQRKRYHYAD